jgi:hypothetical protein
VVQATDVYGCIFVTCNEVPELLEGLDESCGHVTEASSLSLIPSLGQPDCFANTLNKKFMHKLNGGL